MRDDQSDNPLGERLDPSQLDDAALLRAAADDEPGAREALVGRTLDDANTKMTFEQSLREAVGRSMGSAAAPAALRARVIAMLHQAELEEEHAAMSFVEAKARHEAHEGGRAMPRRRHGASLRRGFAIAAVAVLGAGAVWMGLQNSGTPGGTTIGNRAALFNALQSVRQQHDDRAGFDTAYRQRFTTRVSEAIEIAKQELGVMPGCLDKAIKGCEDSGMVFAGLSSCSVPGGSGAVHVMYWSVPDESTVSLFIVATPNGTGDPCPSKNLAGDTSYMCPESLDAGTPLQVWRRGKLTFYLATGHVAPLPVARKLHEAPTAEKMLSAL